MILVVFGDNAVIAEEEEEEACRLLLFMAAVLLALEGVKESGGDSFSESTFIFMIFTRNRQEESIDG